MVALRQIDIQSVAMPINALKVEFLKDPKGCKSRVEADGFCRITLPNGNRCSVTRRFWNSWCSLQGQGRSIFDLFSHGEVFERIHREKKDTVRLTAEMDPVRDVDGNWTCGKLLSCTNPQKPILAMSDAVSVVEQFGGMRADYEDGRLTATFNCPFPTPYSIAGEDYKTQFMLQMPVDGYGMPQSYLTLLRVICSNGMVGMSKAFKTSFQLGRGEDDIRAVLDRAMVTFSAEEGFHSFKLRMEAASKSWASLYEASALYQCLTKAMINEKIPLNRRAEIIGRFDDLCGDPLSQYGLSSRQELSPRRSRTIPVKASMYELMTFGSEISTHVLTTTGSKNDVNAWVGGTVSAEYDLEGTMDEFREWRDFFVKK